MISLMPPAGEITGSTPAGRDVASVAELQHALGAGIRPERIVATGPKNREFLWLAARAGVTVSADSQAELAELARGCDAIISYRQTVGDEALFAALPELKAFVRCAIDIRNIDVA